MKRRILDQAVSHDATLLPSFRPFHVNSNSKVTLAPIQFPQALATIISPGLITVCDCVRGHRYGRISALSMCGASG